MTTVKDKSVKFDPGFAQHTTILSISLSYIYQSLNSFKNFGQKKMKFKLNYQNIIKMVENNVGFCLGSLLWATYIKSLGDLPIEGNPCLGDKYNEAEAIEEIDFSIEYFDQLEKDSKYYLGQTYKADPAYIRILNLYKEFLTLNKNFVETKTTNEIILPDEISVPSDKDLTLIKSKIEEVIETGKLLDLTEVLDLVLSKGK